MATFLDSQATRILNLLNITSLGLDKGIKIGSLATDRTLEIYLSLLVNTYKGTINIRLEEEDDVGDADGAELEKLSKFIYSKKFKQYLEEIELDKLEQIVLSTLRNTKVNLPAYVKVNKNIRYKDTSVAGRNQQQSLIKLKMLINQGLAEKIAKNMGKGNNTNLLNYRTGRFATTAFVNRAVLTKAGAINLFYTYMKYPYQTFETGFAQGSIATRDPRLLISKSIREIATKLVSNQLRTTRE